MRAWLLLALLPGCFLEDRTFEATDAAPPSGAPEILVTMEDVQIPEDERAIISVTLERAPSGPVVVAVLDDTSSATSTEPSSIVFDQDSWDITHEIEIHALSDEDMEDVATSVVLSAPGHDSTWIDVDVIDDDEQTIMWIGQNPVSVGEGNSTTVTMRLQFEPDFGESVSVTSNGDLDLWPTVVGFNGLNYATPQSVTITAPHDADADDDTVLLTAMMAGVPNATITVTVVDDD